MKKRVTIIAVLVLLAALAAVGAFVPLGTYTMTRGCDIEPVPTARLSALRGDSIEKVKAADAVPVNPMEGCGANTRYTLYLL